MYTLPDMKKISAKLQGIPETLLIPLWARAQETRQSDPVIRDESAVEMVSWIDYDFEKFRKSWLTQLGVSVRTMLLDNATRKFLENNPNAVVVNLGAGLDTRHERLEIHRPVDWYDLDVREAMELRKQFFTATEHSHFLENSVLDFSWQDKIDCQGRPVLFIAEGLLMYFTEQELKPLFEQLAERFPGAEMLLEILAPFLVGKSRHHDSLSKVSVPAEFRWGLKNSLDLETWHPQIRFIQEWNYYDYHKARWKWFGKIARLPIIKDRLSNRIVHLRFSS